MKSKKDLSREPKPIVELRKPSFTSPDVRKQEALNGFGNFTFAKDKDDSRVGRHLFFSFNNSDEISQEIKLAFERK